MTGRSEKMNDPSGNRTVYAECSTGELSGHAFKPLLKGKSFARNFTS